MFFYVHPEKKIVTTTNLKRSGQNGVADRLIKHKLKANGFIKIMEFPWGNTETINYNGDDECFKFISSQTLLTKLD